jgi:alpha-beta hydrolase superfamily lysophospholipase
MMARSRTDLPSDLARRTRSLALGPTLVPSLVMHPDWTTPAPVVLWMHGRTVSKELDPGRYLRWVRAGIAAVAIDLPGHGERLDAAMQTPDRVLEVLAAVLPEIDAVVHALTEPRFAGLFDTARMGIGGMSLGGMATLRRLCDPHPFVCASVESTTGDLESVMGDRGALAQMPASAYAELDPRRRRDGFRPVPLLALHSEADELVPIAAQRRFVELLRRRYAAAGADPGLVDLKTWPTTGAPQEHSGFGRVSHEAKSLQTAFFVRWLAPTPPAD